MALSPSTFLDFVAKSLFDLRIQCVMKVDHGNGRKRKIRRRENPPMDLIIAVVEKTQILAVLTVYKLGKFHKDIKGRRKVLFILDVKVRTVVSLVFATIKEECRLTAV